MTHKEALELAISTNWKITTCSSGEKCWCRGVTTETPIFYGDEEELYIIGDGTVHKEIAEHIVWLHNEDVRMLKLTEEMIGL